MIQLIYFYPQDMQNRKISHYNYSIKVRSFFSRGYFKKCDHLDILAKLHCPKGDRINDSRSTVIINKVR